MLRHLIAAGAAILGLTLAWPTLAAPAKFVKGSCIGDFGPAAPRTTCGYLSVDETRGGRSKRRVIVPVVVVKASAPQPGLPPVVFLHGGPGGGIVSSAAAIARAPYFADLVAADQDWIFLDQRGSGLGQPLLDCGELPMNDAGPLSPAAGEALKACAERLWGAGIDLSRFNEKEVALDIEDLRRVLGYEQMDLVGGSYGTAIALAVLRYAPKAVRAVVLDSPWPPEATWAENGPKMVADAVRLIIAKCAADETCAKRFPTLQADVIALSKRFLAGPQKGEARSYTAEDLGGFLMDAAYSGDGARRLPFDLAAMVKGDYSALEAHRGERSPYVEGQHLTHVCKEEFPFEDVSKVAEGAANDPIALLLVPSMSRYFEVCKAWPVGKPSPQDRGPQSGPTPTLWLAAEIDPGCPPALAEAAAARFPNNQLFIVPNATHGVMFDSPCLMGMVKGYLRDPSKPVDPKCMDDLPKWEFTYGG